ncbi:MAG TPA: outer membrane beta-barrel protein [Bacteroidales bacterium]|nr:outer membrane beta-barrel protein [Bacteroidales bacterium]HPS16977.1 outer membrane beta-barrel protein [Bacteroidales bacterium]
MNSYLKIFTSTILLVFISLASNSQSIRGGLICGFNKTQVDGDEVYGYHKYGLNTGAFASVPIKKKFSFSIEILYNQKGSYQKAWLIDSVKNGAYKLILNYLDVPVLFQYEDKDIIKFGTGFSWGRLVDFGEWEHKQKINWDTPTGPYKKSDIDFIFDVQLRLIQGFSFDMRYAYSVAKIRTRIFLTGEKRNQFNNLITLRLMYTFRDKPMPKPKKDKDKE